jgi:rhamnose utilization protein RhaD (predicted bifunctional aldolase and dehydrogenase)
MTMRDQLAAMCHSLGDPALDLVVLAEGNASARASASTLLVTASGTSLYSIGEDELVEVETAAVLDLLRGEPSPVTIPREALLGTVVGDVRTRPSIETVLHAVVLAHTDAAFVGHTHPTAVVGLASGPDPEGAFAGSLFPDEVVVCGPAYLVVPYAAPGPRLALALERALLAFVDAHQAVPKAVVFANHGLLALGATPAEVHAVSVMATKSARVRAIALAAGGLRPLPAAEVAALLGRDDEHERQRRLREGR